MQRGQIHESGFSALSTDRKCLDLSCDSQRWAAATRRCSGPAAGQQGGQGRRRTCHLGLLLRAAGENANVSFLTALCLRPNFSSGEAFDAKNFGIGFGVLE